MPPAGGHLREGRGQRAEAQVARSWPPLLLQHGPRPVKAGRLKLDLDGGAGLGPQAAPRPARQHCASSHRVARMPWARARLARIDDDDWQASGAQGGDHGPLVAPLASSTMRVGRSASSCPCNRRRPPRARGTVQWRRGPRPRPTGPASALVRAALGKRGGGECLDPSRPRNLGQRAGRDDPWAERSLTTRCDRSVPGVSARAADGCWRQTV